VRTHRAVALALAVSVVGAVAVLAPRAPREITKEDMSTSLDAGETGRPLPRSAGAPAVRGAARQRVGDGHRQAARSLPGFVASASAPPEARRSGGPTRSSSRRRSLSTPGVPADEPALFLLGLLEEPARSAVVGIDEGAPRPL